MLTSYNALHHKGTNPRAWHAPFLVRRANDEEPVRRTEADADLLPRSALCRVQDEWLQNGLSEHEIGPGEGDLPDPHRPRQPVARCRLRDPREVPGVEPDAEGIGVRREGFVQRRVFLRRFR